MENDTVTVPILLRPKVYGSIALPEFKRIRKSKRPVISREQLAEMVGVETRTLFRIEEEGRGVGSHLCNRLAAALGVTRAQLMGLEPIEDRGKEA